MSLSLISPNPAPLISAKDVAEVLGVHEDHVGRMARSREIPSYKLGRVRRFKLDEVLSWVDARRA